jgi:hypothetical protein
MTDPFVVLDRHDVRIEKYDGHTVVYRYSPDTSPTLGRLIESRMVTFEDRTVEDRFASAIPMAAAPPLPVARMAIVATDAIPGVRKRKNLTPADVSRRARRQARRAKLKEASNTD